MRHRMLNAKIHRARVTEADLDYVGSISIDPALLTRAGIHAHEQVAVYNLSNGARFETYAMAGGAGDCIVNGAAARLVSQGDRVIVITYGVYDEVELEEYEPTIVHVDERNAMIPEHEAVERAGSNVVWIRST